MCSIKKKKILTQVLYLNLIWYPNIVFPYIAAWKRERQSLLHMLIRNMLMKDKAESANYVLTSVFLLLHHPVTGWGKRGNQSVFLIAVEKRQVMTSLCCVDRVFYSKDWINPWTGQNKIPIPW